MHPKSLSLTLKAFALELYELFSPHWKKVLYMLSAIILISQISVLGSFAVNNQENKAITYALDNDAGRAISTAEKTRWWNSNHFAPYGPLYFRVAHTIATFVPYAGPAEYDPIVKSERIHNLALQLASLCALYGWAFLICSLLLPQLWQRLLILPLMAAAITHSYWANMILRPHPDMMLALTAGLATYATAKWIYEGEQAQEKWAALAWGIAVGTKASIILFTPAFIFLFLPLNKAKLLQGLRFIAWMLLGYTLIGFPQSLSYFKVLSFLLGESAVSMKADSESVMLWFQLLLQQITLPLGLGLFVIIASSTRKLQFESKKALKLFLFCLIPFLVLLTRKQAYNPDHFTMPFFSCLIIGILFILRRSTHLHNRPYFLASFLLVPTVPHTFNDYFKQNQICRPEAKEMATKLEELQKNKAFIAHDPYVPVSMAYPKTSKEIWGMRWVDIEGKPFDALALNKTRFYSRYLLPPPIHLWPQEVQEWPTREEFYRNFDSSDKVVSPSGVKWSKVYQNECGYELWLKDEK